MFTGYLELGGSEIANRQRAWAYARDSQCAGGLVVEPKCEPDHNAIGEAGPFSLEDIDNAPWFDADYPKMSAGFLGFYTKDIQGIDDSTWVAEISEGILSGGSISRGRYAARQIRVTGIMIATAEVSLEHGMSWLMGALSPNTCSSHGASCGEQDLAFFAGCPKPRSFFGSAEDYRTEINFLTRMIHGVKLISGPLVLSQRRTSTGVLIREVEYTLGASSPHVYTRTSDPGLKTSESAFLLDSPINIVEYPSAEKAAATPPVVSTNLVANPSFEVDTTGWATTSSVVSGSSPSSFITSTRSSTLAAVGTYSYLARLLPTSGSGRCTLGVYLSTKVSLSAVPVGGSVSATAWAALLSVSQPATLHALSMDLVFYDSSGAELDRISRPITSDFQGYNWKIKAQKPTGAATAAVSITANVSWVTGSDVRLHVDAVAITVP